MTPSASLLAFTVARGFWRRLRGLMFTAALPVGRGLLLVDCASVHTCFMRFALDVVYLDGQFTIVKLVRGLKPWRFSVGGKQAVHVLELKAGAVNRFGMQVGDRLDQYLVQAGPKQREVRL
ncbi:MAG: hypothetical protein JWP36_744 [Paucimonas sp.]|jgi:uncharacterized membrane protein (UPF0127 family)|nr:hypothetical protein [Paucimonas sp.]